MTAFSAVALPPVIRKAPKSSGELRYQDEKEAKDNQSLASFSNLPDFNSNILISPVPAGETGKPKQTGS